MFEPIETDDSIVRAGSLNEEDTLFADDEDEEEEEQQLPDPLFK